MEDRAPDGSRLTIRAGTPSDAPFIVLLGAAAFAPFGEYGSIMRAFLASADVVSWIAETPRGAAGFALVESDPRLPGFSDLVAIAVAAPQRRTGVGRALLDHVIASCREQGGPFLLVLTVAEDNEPAIAMFRGAGFRMLPGATGRYAGGQRSRRMAISVGARF